MVGADQQLVEGLGRDKELQINSPLYFHAGFRS